jgi:ABC-2 type transport system permease protein
MNSFIPWLKKETLEGGRSYRFLVIGLAAAFFAFLDPVMLKLLPLIMKSQVGADLSSLIPASRDFAFSTFLNDLFEILSLVVCIILGGTVAKERKRRILAVPVTKGASFIGIILAKTITYSIYTAAVLWIAIPISYLYSGILFPGSAIMFSQPIKASLAVSGYFAWLVALVVMASSLFPSSLGASLFSIAAAYGLPALGSLFKVERFFPSYLALASSKVLGPEKADFLPAALFAFTSAVLCLSCAVAAMRKREL